MIWLALLSIGMSVAAQFALKAGMSSPAVQQALAQPAGWALAKAIALQPAVVGGFALYGAGAVVWLSVLSRWDVSKAYPLVGLGFVATAAVGALLGEAVSVTRAVGVLVICTGVWLVARS